MVGRWRGRKEKGKRHTPHDIAACEAEDKSAAPYTIYREVEMLACCSFSFCNGRKRNKTDIGKREENE